MTDEEALQRIMEEAFDLGYQQGQLNRKDVAHPLPEMVRPKEEEIDALHD